MKYRKIKNSFFSTLVVCGLLLIASQAVLAKRPVTPSPDPVVVIDAVVVNFGDSEIEVTGSGLDTISEAILGGADVFGDIDISTQSPSSLVLSFSSDSADKVTQSGSYSLALDGNVFSVYFRSAIFFDNNVATCPCLSTWEYYRQSNDTYSC